MCKSVQPVKPTSFQAEVAYVSETDNTVDLFVDGKFVQAVREDGDDSKFSPGQEVLVTASPHGGFFVRHFNERNIWNEFFGNPPPDVRTP